jgi:hypothetical protein
MSLNDQVAIHVVMDRVKVQNETFEQFIRDKIEVSSDPQMLSICDGINAGFARLHAVLTAKKCGDLPPKEVLWNNLLGNLLRIQEAWDATVSKHPALQTDYQTNIAAQRSDEVSLAITQMIQRVEHERRVFKNPLFEDCVAATQERRTPIKSVHLRVPLETYDHFKIAGGDAGFAAAMADALVGIQKSGEANKC